MDEPIEKNEEPKRGLLSHLGNIFASREAREAQEEVDRLEHGLQAASQEFDRVTTELATATSELAATRETLTARDIEVAALKAELVLAEQSAAAKAAEIAMASHADPADLPTSNSHENNAPANEDELREAMASAGSHREKMDLIKEFRKKAASKRPTAGRN